MTATHELLESVNHATTGQVQAVFDLEARDKTRGPFPSDRFTVRDRGQNTGLRVDLPLPDRAVRPSDYDDITVINTLDGFNITPRISIPFTGDIDPSTVSSRTVFLLKLGSTLPGGGSGAIRVGINQIVWDTATTTLHATSNDALDQHTRYAVVVTSGVKDKHKRPVACEAFERFLRNSGAGHNVEPRLKDYRKELREALSAVEQSGVGAAQVVVASVFTTRSVTTELEKIRRQIHAAAQPKVSSMRTFALDSVQDITVEIQTGIPPKFDPPRFDSPVSFIDLLRAVPGAIKTIAFGKYSSPDYRNKQRVIPPTETKSGAPKPLSRNEIWFDLYLPSGPKPQHGWPIAIVGHGATAHKHNGPAVLFAAAFAAKGIATIAINAPGNGGGPLSRLNVIGNDGSTVPIPSGGRGADTNGDCVIAPGEGGSAAFFPIRDRDRVRQTAVDLMQLVRVIDTLPDVNASQIYYVGQSLGALFGMVFAGVEPKVRAVALSAPFGFLGTLLSPVRGRPNAGAALAARKPSLINPPGISSIDGVKVGGPPSNYFNENLPLRDQKPVINKVVGAMAIQEVFDNTEWVQQSGGAMAYAAILHTRGTPVLLQIGKGDISAPNPCSSMVVRAGNFAATTTLYRHDLAKARNSSLANDPHDFIETLGSTVGGLASQRAIARAVQEQIADFLASDGETIIDPDGSHELFEVPIPLPLPEALSFISTP